jgi:hypothetical protein
MKLKKYLMKARALIADIEDWTQEDHARDADCVVVKPWSPRAICWCADGALAKACGVRSWYRPTTSYEEGSKALSKVSEELYGTRFIRVNDGEADYGLRRNASDQAYIEAAHTAVLRIFDHAIASAP